MKQGSPFIAQKKGKLMMCLFAALTAVQDKMQAACTMAVRIWDSASWLGRIHSGSLLSPVMWPVSDFCLLSRQQKCTQAFLSGCTFSG